jgi:hypothetical protein
MATQSQNTLAARCPRAIAAGRVVGRGTFALLSCRDAADGIRRVHLYHTALERDAAKRKWDGESRGPWDRVGQCSSWSTCEGDHPTIDLEEQ